MSRSFRIKALAIAALLVLVPAGAFARGHATPTPTASPSPPPEDPAITAIARREFVSWQAGVVNRSRYAPETQAHLTDEKIAETSKALGAAGSLVRVEWLGPLGIQDGPPGITGYLYRMVCSNAAVYEQLTVTPDGKVAGIFFRDKLPE